MSDARRRSAERAAALGGPAERARLLVERARLGELSEAGLRIAAYVGDPDALAALGEHRRETPTRGLGGSLGGALPFEAIALGEWVAGLARLEATAHGRGALAALRLVLPLWSRACPRDGRPHRVVDRLEAWVHCPCGPCAAVLRLLADELVEAGLDLLPPGAAHAGQAAEAAGGVPAERRAAGLVALHALRALASERLGPTVDDPPADPRWEAALVDAIPSLRAAVREALTPWALTPRALGGPAASPLDESA